jgi:DNA-directed RNA polymerase specialized sigma24 family protein
MDAIDRELIAIAVDLLPEDERDVINALFFERASYRTIAVRMDCSTTKVIDLRNQALKSLQNLIEKSMEDDE